MTKASHLSLLCTLGALLAAGTDALAISAPALGYSSSEPGKFDLTWETTPGMHYRVERSSSLAEGAWEKVTEDQEAQGNGMSYQAGATGERMFYRVVVTDSSPIRATTLRVWGDSITQNNSTYGYDAVVGSGYAMQYRIRAAVPHPELFSVTHLQSGRNTPLQVSFDGSALSVQLATDDNGAVISTIDEVRSAVLSSYSGTFFVNDFEQGKGLHLAQAQARTYGTPYSWSSPTGVYTWLKARMKGRFKLVQRLHNSYGISQANPEGAWNHGYAGQTAMQAMEPALSTMSLPIPPTCSAAVGGRMMSIAGRTLKRFSTASSTFGMSCPQSTPPSSGWRFRPRGDRPKMKPPLRRPMHFCARRLPGEVSSLCPGSLHSFPAVSPSRSISQPVLA